MPLALSQLKNVGPATLGDFQLLGIHSVSQLAQQDPTHLYEELQRLTGQRQDPCVHDVFSATIHQAQTGEALPWWHFSRLRKRTRDTVNRKK